MPYIANGEVVPTSGSLIISPEERMQYEKIKEAKQFYSDVRYDSQEHGGFTFMKTNEYLIESMQPETVGRLAFLSTYMPYGEQTLVDDETNTIITKSDLPYILHLSRPVINNFYDQCVSAGIMEDKGKQGLILKGVFFKGKSTDKSRIKLYINTIRQLYKRLPKKNHKYFGYIIQLVPWINYEWNIVCHNPQETDCKLAKPMMLKEICSLLNYNAIHSYRLKEALTGIWFEWNNTKQALCAIVNVNTEDGRQQGLIVNPHLVFAGTNFKKVEGFGMFFVPHERKALQ